MQKKAFRNALMATVAFFATIPIRSQAGIDAPCGPGTGTSAISNPVFAYQTRLGNGGQDYAHSAIRFSTGEVLPWLPDGNLADLKVDQSQFFLPNADKYPGYAGRKYDDHPVAAIREVLLELGFVGTIDCAEHPGDFDSDYFPARKGAVYCVRTRDGQSYVLSQVSQVCSDGIVFKWQRPSREGHFAVPAAPAEAAPLAH
jgi:hypothetical protein